MNHTGEPPAICVFGGSRPGARASYAQVSREAGQAIARAGYGLVYGGGPDGVMGTVTEGVWDPTRDLARRRAGLPRRHNDKVEQLSRLMVDEVLYTRIYASEQARRVAIGLWVNHPRSNAAAV